MQSFGSVEAVGALVLPILNQGGVDPPMGSLEGEPRGAQGDRATGQAFPTTSAPGKSGENLGRGQGGERCMSIPLVRPKCPSKVALKVRAGLTPSSPFVIRSSCVTQPMPLKPSPTVSGGLVPPWSNAPLPPLMLHL
jgi:hypothetical protein